MGCMNSIIAVCLFLTIRFVDGNECSFPADGLSMTVVNEKLVVESDNVSASLTIGDLASMRFTDSAAADISQVSMTSPFEVISLSGQSLGSFKSTEELKNKLPGGTYILRQGKNTIKISI